MAELIPLELPRFEDNLARVRKHIEDASRPEHGPCRVVIVSKYLSPEDARRLREAGHGPLGENRAPGLEAKVSGPEDRAGWHFIGHLQRNKIARILPRVALFHALDSSRLAQAIDHWVASRGELRCRCLVQVNISGEDAKGGISPEEARDQIPSWVEQWPGLRLEGLMTMAPLQEAEACRPLFRGLRDLRDQLRNQLPADAAMRFRELSMGMSNDYRVAIEEGATLVRLGRLLYR